MIEFDPLFRERGGDAFTKYFGRAVNALKPRSVLNVLKYVTKEGNIDGFGSLSLPNVRKRLKKQAGGRGITHRIGLRLQAGSSAEEILMDEELGPSAWRFTRQMDAAAGSIARYRERERERLPYEAMSIPALSVTELQAGRPSVQVAEWCNRNLAPGYQMPTKSRDAALARQLWITGAANAGKSTLISILRQRLNVYDVYVGSGDWDNPYKDGDYELAVMDDFEGGKPVKWFKLWCEGGRVDLNVKFKGTVVKKVRSSQSGVANAHRYNYQR